MACATKKESPLAILSRNIKHTLETVDSKKINVNHFWDVYAKHYSSLPPLKTFKVQKRSQLFQLVPDVCTIIQDGNDRYVVPVLCNSKQNAVEHSTPEKSHLDGPKRTESTLQDARLQRRCSHLEEIADRIRTVLLSCDVTGVKLSDFWKFYAEHYTLPDMAPFKVERRSQIFPLIPHVCKIKVVSDEKMVVLINDNLNDSSLVITTKNDQQAIKSISSAQQKSSDVLENKRVSRSLATSELKQPNHSPRKEECSARNTSVPPVRTATDIDAVKSGQSVASTTKTVSVPKSVWNVEKSSRGSTMNPEEFLGKVNIRKETHQGNQRIRPHHAEASFHHQVYYSSSTPQNDPGTYFGASNRLRGLEKLNKEQRESKINSVVSDIINRLVDDEEHVCYNRIEAEVKKYYSVNSIEELGVADRRHWSQFKLDFLPAMKEQTRTLCKVNAYIQAFVKARSVATVHELQSCLLDLFGVTDFCELRIGPILKLPMVYKYFKTPSTIAEITTIDVLTNLEKFLTEKNLWKQQIEMEDFLLYLVETYNVETVYHLGIKMNSVALLIQVIGRANRHRSQALRNALEYKEEEVLKEVSNAFQQTVGKLIEPQNNGYQMARQYQNIDSMAAMQLVFGKFVYLIDNLLVICGEVGSNGALVRKLTQSKNIVTTFSSNLVKGQLFSNDLFVELLRLAICASADKLQSDVENVLLSIIPKEEPTLEDNSEMKDRKIIPARAELLAEAKQYFKRFLAAKPLNLKCIMEIELRMLKKSKFDSFGEFGQGTFLEFLLESDIPKFLEDEGSSLSSFGGTSICSTDVGFYQCSRENILSFICQTELTNLDEKEQSEQLATIICSHYGVKEVKHLQHGNIKLLLKQANQQKNKMDSVLHYASALCSRSSIEWSGAKRQSGKLGDQSVNTALACLQQCPVLGELEKWSHWSLVFKPKLGSLKRFIDKYGYMRTTDITECKAQYEMKTNIHALETAPGHLIRINPESTYANFADAASRRDVHLTCAHLVSIIAIKKGVDKTPLDLMGSEIEQTLKQNTGVVKDSFEIEAEQSTVVGRCASGLSMFSDKGSSWNETQQTYCSVQFVLECFMALPEIMLEAVADKVFLKPLSKVVGNKRSKKILLSLAEKTTNTLSTVQHLGLVLGIDEWRSTINKRFQCPRDCLTRHTEDVILPPSCDEFVDEEDELLEDDSESHSIILDEVYDIEDETYKESQTSFIVSDIEQHKQRSVSTRSTISDISDENDIEKFDVKVTAKDVEFSQTKDFVQSVKICEERTRQNTVESSCSAGINDTCDDNTGDHLESKETDSSNERIDVECYEEFEGFFDLFDDDTSYAELVSNEELAIQAELEEQRVLAEQKLIEEEHRYLESLKLHISCDEERPRYEFITKLRRDEFGIGVDLTKDGELLMDKQQKRLGRSLDRLSTDLYSKDIHFVLELIQNADDNSYDDAADFIPSVLFLVESDMISVYNNETGFVEKQVKAVCDVGSSTKPKENPGFIGQKGIGFKSVFRITDRPEIHSNHFHWYFDKNSCALGYIMPWWIDKDQRNERDLGVIEGKRWTTIIRLPLKNELVSFRGGSTLASKFQDLHPSLLLFLHRLRKMIVMNKAQNCLLRMQRHDLSNNLVKISQISAIGDDGNDKQATSNTFLLSREVLDSSKISVKAKSGVLIARTEVVLAFPIKSSQDGNDGLSSCLELIPQKQPVFAYLPLRSYGFNFIVQADFEVPSSREDVNNDSMWNQWLRDEIPHVFVNALDVFKNHKSLPGVKSVCAFLRFVPLEDEVVGFFRPVATEIIRVLRSKPCMPVTNSNSNDVEWRLPSQTVIIEDNLTREVLTPALLKKYLGVSLLHEDVRSILSDSMRNSLGIKTISTDHLIEVGPAIVNDLKNAVASKNSEEVNVCMNAVTLWLVCVHRSLDVIDNDRIITDLKQHPMIVLSNGSLVSLNTETVFVDLGKSHSSGKKKKKKAEPRHLTSLKEDLNIMHDIMLSVSRAEYRHDLLSLYEMLGVHTLQPHHIVHKHIVPILQRSTEELLKCKSQQMFENYVVYIKEELENDGQLISMATLKELLIVRTNHGLKRLSDAPLHFHHDYNCKVQLLVDCPGYDWLHVHPVYLMYNAKTSIEVGKWLKFFKQLGVEDGLIIEKKIHKLTPAELKSSKWSMFSNKLQKSDDYQIEDHTCCEFEQLVNHNTSPDHDSMLLQMDSLFKILQESWNDRYYIHTKTTIKDSQGNVLQQEVETTFARTLRELAWVPSYDTKVVEKEPGKYTISKDTISLKVPSLLYVYEHQIYGLLAHFHSYPAPKLHRNSNFSSFLQIHHKIEVHEIKAMLLELASKSECITSMAHIANVYNYLCDNLPNRDSVELFRTNSVIFCPERVPATPCEYVKGEFVGRSDVWVSEPTGLIDKYRRDGIMDTTQQSGQTIFKYCLRKYYDDETATILVDMAKIAQMPTITDYLLLWCEIAENNVQSRAIDDVFKLWHFICDQLHKDYYEIGDLKNVLKGVRSRKIVPTTSVVWVSLAEYPMIADDANMEKKFNKFPNVHFINMGHKEDETGLRDAILQFMTLCNVMPLSECIKTETVTENLQPFPALQRYMSIVVPYLQRILYHEYKSQYKVLKKRGILSMWEHLHCNSVKQLELVHSLEHDFETVVAEGEKCRLDENNLYVHKDSMDNYNDINSELARVVSDNELSMRRAIKQFLNQLHSLLPSITDLNEFCETEEIGELPSHEIKWHVEPPPPDVTPQPPTPQPPTPPPEEVQPHEVQYVDEEFKIRCWPPMNPDAQRNNSKILVAKHTPDRPEIWPPPAPPKEMEVNDDIGMVRREGHQEGLATSGQPGTQTDVQHPVVHENAITISQSEEVQRMQGTGQHRQHRKAETKPAVSTNGTDDDQTKDDSNSDNRTCNDSNRPTEPAISTASDTAAADRKVESEKNPEITDSTNASIDTKPSCTEDATDQTSDPRVVVCTSEHHHNQDDHPATTNPSSQVQGDVKVIHQHHHDNDGNHGNREKRCDTQSQSGAKVEHVFELWDKVQELVYEDLNFSPSVKELDTINKILLAESNNKRPSSEEERMIGKMGEFLVNIHLNNLKEAQPNTVIDVDWIQEDTEHGTPYDFILTLKDAENVPHKKYIEVKSTRATDKRYFQISMQQIRFALKHQNNFYLYRVFGVGSPSDIRLTRIQNLASKLEQKQINLMMLL